MNLVLETIARRRSVRAFLSDQIEDGILQSILEAGRCAPSGGNTRTTRLFVIQDTDTLKRLRGIVENAFAQMEVQEGMYKSLRSSILLSKKGGYDFSHQAPTLVMTVNHKDYGNAMADSACILENMMIAATSLNVGSCWINQLHWLDENKEVRGVLAEFGVTADETVTASLALGYPQKDTALHPQQKDGDPIIYVR